MIEEAKAKDPKADVKKAAPPPAKPAPGKGKEPEPAPEILGP